MVPAARLDKWDWWYPSTCSASMAFALVLSTVIHGPGAREIVAISIAGPGLVLLALGAVGPLGIALSTAGVVTMGLGRSEALAWGALMVLIGAVAVRSGPQLAAALVSGHLVLFTVEVLVQKDPSWLNWAAGSLIALVSGAIIHRYKTIAGSLRDAQAELAAKAASEERQRIAGEVHDVIAHSLAVMMLHVSGARLAVLHEPDEAVAALAEAERLGREALQELRQTVGLLGSHSGASKPQPGIREIAELAAEYRATGMPVELEVHGDLGLVAPTVGLTAYRIVQEALANAARHAPGAAVIVEVLVDDVLGLCVTNGRRTRIPDDIGTGRGLAGMQDRARVVGGRITASPWKDGWRVEAVLPLAAVRA